MEAVEIVTVGLVVQFLAIYGAVSLAKDVAGHLRRRRRRQQILR
jgi:hypothetical protein